MKSQSDIRVIGALAIAVAAAAYAAPPRQLPQQHPPAAAAELGIVVDLSLRQLDVRIGGELRGTFDVAVGKPGHETLAGTYGLSRVIWNPHWIPPDSEWAEGEERTPPGDPDNMGRVKIFFDDLLYIHGTDATGTLCEPAPHGCIRMSNEDATALARLVMEHGGAERGESWYASVRSNRTETYEVEIPRPPVLRISR